MSTIADLFDQAVRYHQSGNLAQAELLYRQVIQVDPENASVHNNLGVALKNQGRLTEAIESFRQALRLNPSHAGACNNLGTALFNTGKIAEAQAAYRQCLRLEPDFADAHNNLGNVLLSQGQFQEAMAGFQKALQLKPNYANAYTNLGNALRQQGNLTQAAACFRQALAIDPGYATALWNRSLLLLLQGDFEDGWRDFHWREALPDMIPRSFRQPRWDGSPLPGKTILVYAEQAVQGFGDTIQFVRYMPSIHQRGGTVVFECQPALFKLLNGFPGIDQLVPFGTSLPPFDAQIPLLHLPAVFGTTLATIPPENPYLAADTRRVEYWRRELECHPLLNVGIIWEGSMNQVGDRRSVPLALFEAIARVEGVRLVSLQVGPGRKQLEAATFPVIDLGGRFDPNSLDDLAAAIMIMNLVVTVDTAGAHLAGALGVPVWTLLQFAPDWRWLLDRTDCPWYPSMRLFRQNKIGAWGEVFERLAVEIRRAYQAGRHDLGIALLNHGIVLFEQGQYARAAECFREALPINPNQAEIYNYLGNALYKQGQWAEAAECYRQALRISPHFVEAHNNLGSALKDQGRLGEAAASCGQALRLDPKYADAHYNLGNIRFAQGLLAEAAESFRQALKINPNHIGAHNNLGNVLKVQGQLAEAADCYREALRIEPNQADLYNNLGIVLKDQGQPAVAAECFRQAIYLNSNHGDSHDNLGAALVGQGLLASAGESFQKAIFLNAGNADYHGNLGVALAGQGLLADAEESFQQALRIDANHWFSLWNRSLIRLLQEDFTGGWRDYEQRWAQPGKMPRSFQQPRWDGTSLVGKTILVHAEQGLGDTIQFVRYLPMVQRCGGTVVFECQPPLLDLLAEIPGVSQLVSEGSPLPPFDVQIPLLSLPGIFQTTRATIPADVPYIKAKPELVSRWKQELQSLNGYKIGICWQGNPTFGGDRLRSIPLRYYEPLARLPGVSIVSLQKDAGVDQLRSWAGRFPILDLSERLETFSDTAAVMINLDLVVTSDTSIPHLAGALGIPVWTVLQLAPDWRWFLGRSDCPWYPTMRLFRQNTFGDWGEVFERIAVAIRQLAFSVREIPRER